MNGRRTKLLVASLFILWLFFVLASFFAVQKPFSAANALAIGGALLDLLAAGWLGLVALAMGTWFLPRLLPPPGGDPQPAWGLELAVLGAGLGLGALGLLGLALGLAGLFQPVVAYGVTIALSAIFLPQAVQLFRRLRAWRPANPPPLPAAVYLSLFALLTLLTALLPPTGWDSLFYHLTGPKLYLQSGRIAGGVDIPHLSFPSVMEMLYAWAILLRGDIAAKLLHALFGLLLAGLVYLTARRFLGRKAAWPAVLLFASMPMVSALAGWAYNDLALAYFQLACLYSVIRYLLSPSALRHSPLAIRHSPFAWLILSGIFAGLAMGLKYTSFVTPLTLTGLIVWYACRDTRRTPKPAIYSLAAFALPALLVALPWYVKNWIFTGNPVYPFLFDLFGGQYWDSFRAGWYAAAGTGIGWQPDTLLALPWLVTLGVHDANYWDGRTGPLFLLFLPLILYYGLFYSRRHSLDRQSPAVTALLVFALAQFAFWVLGVIWTRSLWQSRLLLPGLVALAPVAGRVWVDLPRFDLPQFSLSRFVNLAIGLVLALTLLDIGLLTLKIDPLLYLTGLESRAEYLTGRLGAHYAAMQRLNAKLPPDAVVTFLWEPRSYYCRLDCRPDSILDAFPHLVDRHGSAEAIAQTWRAEGVTHVLIHRTGLNFLLSQPSESVNTTVLSELETNALRLVFDVEGAYQVYALEPAP